MLKPAELTPLSSVRLGELALEAGISEGVVNILALRVARAIDTGVLSINSNSSVRPSTPFGGFKQSGFGRELGMHALEGYSEVKNVFYSTD